MRIYRMYAYAAKLYLEHGSAVAEGAVAEDDVPKTEERYNKAKEVHSIVRNTSDKTGRPMKEIYEQVAWPLYGE